MAILRSINNNIIILPAASAISNPIEYLKSILPALSNKKFAAYLEELYSDIHHFAEGVDLLVQSIIAGKKIGIIGDYDVDGTVGTSIITKFFNWLNSLEFFSFGHIYHIPNRFKEGYGPSVIAIERFIKEEVKLIITVDSGTTANKEVQMARDHHIDTLILDHHLIQNEIPNATCFVNCQNSTHFKNLSGGGLAFVFLIHVQKQLKKIYKDLPNFDFNEFIDLVALSTVCDFVSLKGINRLLVEFGLKKFNWQYNKTDLDVSPLNKAINIILQYSMYYYNSKTHIKASDLGFAIGPYLNVAGRMSDGNLIVEFLTELDLSLLEDKFFQLQSLWQERRKLQEEIILNLELTFADDKPYILLYSEYIHEGIMGIIAAQFKEKYYKPTIVIALNGDVGKGSIRSLGSFNAGEFIEKEIKSGVLVKGGGHHMAGGFVIKRDNIALLSNALEIYMQNLVIEKEKHIKVHMVLSMEELDENFYNQLQVLGPFGIDYEEPVFLFANLVIKNTYIMNQKHISFRFSDITERQYIKAMWFFVNKHIIEKFITGLVVSVIGYIKMVNGKIEIQIIDMILEN